MVRADLLRYATVECACKDYEWSIRYLNRLDHVGLTLTHSQVVKVEKAKMLKDECERFFRSDWFKILCDLDGETLMRKLQHRAVTEKRAITRGRL